MKLSDIIKDSGVLQTEGNASISIDSIATDSRKVESGALFIAVKGYAGDGHDYIQSALDKGAVAIAYEDEQAVQAMRSHLETQPVWIQVSNSRHAVAMMAANFYDHPSDKLTLVGITGTNGKTTTVTLLYHLFMDLGYQCGLLSTIANYVGKEELPTTNTTADPITINSLMDEMVKEGCEYCFMEVSSIGMEQERVAGLHFKAGIFSNLTHDHLDYHKTFAEYLRCKKLFFDQLPADAFAITNIDDKNGMVMVQNTAAEIVTYSCQSLADHTCRIMEKSLECMQLKMDGKETWTRLIGKHNAYNLLAIYTTAVVLGADEEEVLVAISRLESAKGRLETMNGPKGINVVIDYAHTPDAMENVLKTLREIAPERELVCLFGCGGDRDKTKRPEMAQVAEKYADKIFVTSDNSRTEKTADIMEDIRKGFGFKGLKKSLFIEDRKEAIKTSLLLAQEGSTILLAGKGHETYQIIGTEHHHFDEREIVNEVFQLMN